MSTSAENLIVFHHKYQHELASNNHHVDDFVQDCSNSIANALELLQSCTKPLMYMCGMVHLTTSNQWIPNTKGL